MPSASANGITIEYETAGDPASPPLLLVMGLGGQLIAWDDAFVRDLAAAGFWVIRYDNRDVGRSTWFDQAGAPDVMAAMAGHGRAAYLLSDMAADAVGLLDALSVPSAHVVGVSMGGMIAQTMGIEHASRVRSLVSIMSTTGDTSVGQPHPEALEALLVVPARDRAGAIDQGVAGARVIGYPGLAFDEARVRDRAAAAYDRAFHPDGTGRQLVAILSSGDRTKGLGGVEVPTLVIHGEADPLVDVSGGRATAAAVPGARLKLFAEMGHDLPVPLWREIIDEIATFAHPHDGRSASAPTGASA